MTKRFKVINNKNGNGFVFKSQTGKVFFHNKNNPTNKKIMKHLVEGMVVEGNIIFEKEKFGIIDIIPKVEVNATVFGGEKGMILCGRKIMDIDWESSESINKAINIAKEFGIDITKDIEREKAKFEEFKQEFGNSKDDRIVLDFKWDIEKFEPRNFERIRKIKLVEELMVEIVEKIEETGDTEFIELNEIGDEIILKIFGEIPDDEQDVILDKFNEKIKAFMEEARKTGKMSLLNIKNSDGKIIEQRHVFDEKILECIKSNDA